MKSMDRRSFLLTSFGGVLIGATNNWRKRPLVPATAEAAAYAELLKDDKIIMTISGPIPAEQLGTTLIHEHFLVDFIGADRVNPNRYDRNNVLEKVLPYLEEARKVGVKSIFDCTPAFLGRDVILLQELASQGGIQLITNTGYYGAVNNKYLPPWAFTETAEQLANRWINEAQNGIDNTNVKPGFIKISVDSVDPLSDLHKKLVRAAAITHLKTGLTICSHTGVAIGAFQQLTILKNEGVHPSAFVWAHAQEEKDFSTYVQAAGMGAWISLDGMGWGDLDKYIDALVFLKNKKLLQRTLISHDAGWYKPEDPDADFQGYTTIFAELIPQLLTKGFNQRDIDQLLVKNPAAAMQIQVRKGV